MFWVQSDFRGSSRCVAGVELRATDRQLAGRQPDRTQRIRYSYVAGCTGFFVKLFSVCGCVFTPSLAHALNPARNHCLGRSCGSRLCLHAAPHACYRPAVYSGAWILQHLAVPSQRLHLRRLGQVSSIVWQHTAEGSTRPPADAYAGACRCSCICSVSQPAASTQGLHLRPVEKTKTRAGVTPRAVCCH